MTEAFLFVLPNGDLERRALPSGVLRTEAMGVAGIKPDAFSLLKVDLSVERFLDYIKACCMLAVKPPVRLTIRQKK